ncbi:MAG: hypothetical protein JKY15_01900 [Deltaproteobacteria bacterium]|nr:hypothetical protein [Deltaproteobacteria bacterium]
MGWAAIIPATGRLVFAHAFEFKIDKFITSEKNKGIKLVKKRINYSVPSKRKLAALREYYGADKVDSLGMIKR